MTIFQSSLYKSILMDPIAEKCDELHILSGFATAAMAERHVRDLDRLGAPYRVFLTVGMTPSTGVSESNHEGYKKVQSTFPDKFCCGYLPSSVNPSHSKIYCWLRSGKPLLAFVGSANYSQLAFLGLKEGRVMQREALAEAEPLQAMDIILEAEKHSVDCRYGDIERELTIMSDERFVALAGLAHTEHATEDGSRMPSVTLTLLNTRTKLVHESDAGLNWGFRKKPPPRDLAQAYIPVPRSVALADFFPPRTIRFQVRTDDGHILSCVIAQDNGKAIHTPNSNAELGEYFRKRLGLDRAARVSTEDLLRYGRTDVTFFKVDEETYIMDFSPNRRLE